ncbi:MAG: response regulator, partial [Chloroflexota bacterium]
IHITTRNTAEAGFSYLQSPQRFVDLIISDYNLPGMTGLELCNRLRQVDNRTPLILTTGNGDEGVAVQALRSGVSEYIIKSSGTLFRSQLIKAIPTLLKQWETSQKLEKEVVALREQNRLLAAENRTLSKFTQSVSHNLYTQLSQLAGFSDLLSTNQTLPEANRERCLAQIQAIAQESISTIDALLNRAVESKGTVLEQCHTQITLNSALNRLASKIRDGDIKIFVPKQLPDVQARADWLETVWINLIDFALAEVKPGSRLTVNYESNGNKGYRFAILGAYDDPLSSRAHTQAGTSLLSVLEAKSHTPTDSEVGLGVVHRIINRMQGTSGINVLAEDGFELYFELLQPQTVVQRIAPSRTKPRLADLAYPRSQSRPVGKAPSSIIERFELLFSRNHA